MDNRSAIACLPLLTVLGFSGSVWAGSNVWTPSGPDGGIMKVIATDPTSSSVVYAGAQAGGIWKSTDAGASWKSIGPSSTLASTVNSIAISPSLPSTVYVAVGGSGVWRSTDAGATWAAANNGIANNGGDDFPTVNSLAVDPGHSTTVYAGGARGESSTDAGMYKTTDGGAHWIQMNSGIVINLDRTVKLVRIDPNDPTDLFIATSFAGVYRSTNSGSTWTKFCDNTLDGKSITDLKPFPDLGTVFALSDGLYESSSTHSSGIAPEAVTYANLFWNSILDALIRIGVAYPGSMESVYRKINASPTGTPAAATLPHLYLASGDNGLAISTDGAVTWQLINTGLPSLDFEALAVDNGNENVAYTGGQGDGVFKSSNAGSSWVASSHGLQAAWVEALAVAPSSSSTIYAGLAGVGGARRSTDGGSTWTMAIGTPNALGDLNVTSIAVDPANSSVVYVAANGYTNATDYIYGVFKSTDGGAHWAERDSGVDQAANAVGTLAVARSNGSILYATSRNKIYKSTDAGDSWKEQTAATGLVPFPELLAIDPTTPSTVFVGTYENGIYRTTDGGTSWSNVINVGSIQSLAIDPSHPATVYAGVYGNAVLKTTNSGALWTNLTSGLTDPGQSTIVSPVSIVVDPSDSTTVYLTAPFIAFGVEDPKVFGVFVSHDSGNTWSPLNSGLTNFSSTCLAIAPNGASSTVYLGTEGAGVQAFAVTIPPRPRQAGGIGANPIRHVGGRG